MTVFCIKTRLLNTERQKKDNMSLKVVFMGTPDFAVPVLHALNNNFDVVGVVTKADKPKGRGNKMAMCPVKEAALALNIPVLSPESVRTEDFEKELSSFGADIFVTAAYGKILPENILALPKMGCVNVHASILPYYRGAAPLWRVVLNGEKETGVTTMLTDIGMDTGDILLCEKLEISEDMTTGDVHDAMSELGARIIVDTLNGLVKGEIKPVPQDHEKATYAPMVDREDGRIKWSSGCRNVHNTVRGCNPFPGAFSFLDGEKIKIWKTLICRDKSVLVKAGELASGTVISASDKGITVSTGDGAVIITELQRESSKRMAAGPFLNGRPIAVGSIFTETE